jgi:hypothetical protein
MIIYLIGCLIIGLFSKQIVLYTAEIIFSLSTNKEIVYSALTLITDIHLNKYQPLFKNTDDLLPILHFFYVFVSIAGSWLSILVLILITIYTLITNLN